LEWVEPNVHLLRPSVPVPATGSALRTDGAVSYPLTDYLGSTRIRLDVNGASQDGQR